MICSTILWSKHAWKCCCAFDIFYTLKTNRCLNPIFTEGGGEFIPTKFQLHIKYSKYWAMLLNSICKFLKWSKVHDQSQKKEEQYVQSSPKAPLKLKSRLFLQSLKIKKKIMYQIIKWRKQTPKNHQKKEIRPFFFKSPFLEIKLMVEKDACMNLCAVQACVHMHTNRFL